MMFTNRMRYFAKRVINPLMGRSAGSARSHFALVRHVGRRSGKTYETPLIVFPRTEDFIIVLTYGPKVDWYRNLLAAGQGTLLWHGETYRIGKPESMDRTLALLTFSPFQRFMMRLLDNQYFVRVKSSGLEPVRT
jgi:deazaflavin-dependent oxidoreductase (nitroreductase family)